MAFSSTNLPVRNLDELRKLSYKDLNSAEIDKLKSEDFAAYTVAENAVNGIVPSETPTEPVVAAEPPKRMIWRNGEAFEITAPVRYVNGVIQQ